MGSSGQKRRKRTSKPQHLPKVGTTPAEHQHLERKAVADTMGLGNAPSWLRSGLVIIVVLLVIGAVGALLFINTFF